MANGPTCYSLPLLDTNLGEYFKQRRNLHVHGIRIKFGPSLQKRTRVYPRDTFLRLPASPGAEYSPVLPSTSMPLHYELPYQEELCYLLILLYFRSKNKRHPNSHDQFQCSVADLRHTKLKCGCQQHSLCGSMESQHLPRYTPHLLLMPCLGSFLYASYRLLPLQ